MNTKTYVILMAAIVVGGVLWIAMWSNVEATCRKHPHHCQPTPTATVPPPVCDNGEHTGNPHCPTPTPTATPEVTPTATPTVEPTPEPTETPEPTPTSTPPPDDDKDSCFDVNPNCDESTPVSTPAPDATPSATPVATPPALGPAPIVTPEPYVGPTRTPTPAVQLPPSGVLPGAPDSGSAGLKDDGMNGWTVALIIGVAGYAIVLAFAGSLVWAAGKDSR